MKSNIELIQDNISVEENTVPTQSRRKGKKIAVMNKPPVAEEAYEESVEMTPDTAAAHFISDSTNYNVRTHAHYHGNK